MQRIIKASISGLALLLTGAAFAAEPVQLDIQLDTIVCNGTSYLTQNQLLFLENYTDGVLPDPAPITRAFIWYDGADPLPATPYGNISYAIDPQQQWVNASGFPTKQLVQGTYLKTLGIWQFAAGGSRLGNWNEFTSPFLYHSGDAFVVAPECNGTGQLPAVFIGLTYLGPGDITNPPAAPPWTLYSGPLDHYTSYSAGVSLRSVISGPTAAAPKGLFRVHISNSQAVPPGFDLPPMNITDVWACPQSGTSSSCASAPVQLKFNHKSARTIVWNQWAWSDWMPLPLSVGQNALVTVSFFGGGTVNWVLRESGGLGAWASLTYSGNTIDMQPSTIGGVSYPAGLSQPGWTQVIDRVQMQ